MLACPSPSRIHSGSILVIPWLPIYKKESCKGHQKVPSRRRKPLAENRTQSICLEEHSGARAKPVGPEPW